MQVLLLSNPCFASYVCSAKSRQNSDGFRSVVQVGKIRPNARRRHKLRSSVIEPVVIPPEYENDSTRGKGRPVIDVNSDPWQRFTRWLQRLFAGRLLPVVLFVCCVLASTAFYNHDVARQLDNRPQTTISVLSDAEVEKQISPFVQVHLDSANSNFRTVSGILWNKTTGTVVTKYHLIKDTKSLSMLTPNRGSVDLSVIAVDEERDIAILEMNQELQRDSDVNPEVLESVSDNQAVWTIEGDEDDFADEEWVPERVSSSSLFEELDKERALSDFMTGVTRYDIDELINQERSG